MLIAENFLCLWCRHSNIHPGDPDSPYLDCTCTAFPEGIPAAIMDNEIDHRQPVAGDNGIRFEPRDSPRRIPEIVARIKFPPQPQQHP